MFGHVTDIGGKVACSMPNDAHSIFEVRSAMPLCQDPLREHSVDEPAGMTDAMAPPVLHVFRRAW